MPRRRSFWILSVVALIASGYLLSQYFDRIAADPAAPPSARTLAETAAGNQTGSQPPSQAASSNSHLVWATSRIERAYTGITPPPPLLAGIQTASAADYDRITFSFTGAKPPGYRAEFTAQAVNEDSGQPVILSGPVILQLTFSPASNTGSDGKPTMATPPGIVVPNLPGLRSYLLNGNFENHMSFALGLASESGYHITEVNPSPNTWTIVVDVHH
jgi:hypothetical protein